MNGHGSEHSEEFSSDEPEIEFSEESHDKDTDDLEDGYSDESEEELDNESEDPGEARTLETALGTANAAALRRLVQNEKDMRLELARMQRSLRGLRTSLVQLCYGRRFKGSGIDGGHLYSFWLYCQGWLEISKAKLADISTNLAEILSTLELNGVRIDGLCA